MSNVTYFAKTNFRGQDRVFGVKEKDRLQHMYIIGQTGTGKTTLLKNLAVQDIKSGQGLAVIDPHGEFVDELLSLIPLERAEDVVYFNPIDTEYPIGFNILEVKNPEHKHLVASGLMAVFTKIWAGVWSARMEYILNNCVLALLDTPETTLMGIPRLLVDKEYRKKIVGNVRDPVVKAFWTTEYESWEPRFRNEAIVPIQNKVGQFLATKMIRNIVGQPRSTLDIENIIENRKILLINVSKGLIGEDNSALLGAMLITKIQLMAMERVKTPMEERHPFFLHIDEFQNFATDSFATILSEARKYGLALIISHQYIGQLVTENSTRVRDAIFGNAGTLLSFRVGAIDAEFLESQFAPEIMAIDLVNLPNYNIYLKLLVDGISSRPFSALTLPPIPLEKELVIKEKITEASRRRYGNKRETVEQMIEKWSEPMDPERSREGPQRASASYGMERLMPLKSKESRKSPMAKSHESERSVGEKGISLNDLAKREPENFKRKTIEPDLEGVRKALEKAVEKG